MPTAINMRPKISAINQDYLNRLYQSWVRMGSREGCSDSMYIVTGPLPVGGEIQVNTTTAGQQMQPGGGGLRWRVSLRSFGPASPVHPEWLLNLYAQRYANVSSVLQPMSAPFVYAPFNLSNSVYVPLLEVSWPMLSGISSCSNFEVYVDGSLAATVAASTNRWVMGSFNGLAAGTTHSFQVDYVTTDEHRRSPISPAGVGGRLEWNQLLRHPG